MIAKSAHKVRDAHVPSFTPETDPSPNPVAGDVRRNIARSYGDGAFYSLMVGFGETYLPAFALAIGLGEVTAGLLASIPLLIGGLLQLFAPRGLALAKSSRRWVVWCATIQALSYVPLAVAAANGYIAAWALFAFAALYWGFGMAAGPVWNNWIDATIPKTALTDFLAKRSRLTQLATFLAFAGGGILLQFGHQQDMVLWSFFALFLLACLSRLISAFFLHKQDDAPAPEPCQVPWRQVIARFTEPASSRFLLFLLVQQISVNVAAPFFSPYILAHVGLSYSEYVVLVSAPYVTKVAFYPLITQIVKALSPYRALIISGFFIAPAPLFWFWTPDLLSLTIVQILAGFMWGCFELSSMLLIFDRIAPNERLRILVLNNLMNAACIVVGSIIGSAAFTVFSSTTAYCVIFAASAAARGLSLGVLLRGAGMRVRFRKLYVRTVGLRPTRGALEQPILTSVDSEVDSAGDKPHLRL